MKRIQNTYLDLYVATERVQRRSKQAEAEWNQWLERVQLAKKIGEPQLAQQARERAMRAAEREIDLRIHEERTRRRLKTLRRLI